MSWICIGLGADVTPGMAVPCRIDGIDLALWRSASGVVHLWGDRCPHRGMRLSHGFVRGERLACIYHGWEYGAAGGCAYIPAHPALDPPKSIHAATHACTERGGAIWGAIGSAEGEPPETACVLPVRSLTVEAPLEAVRGHFGADVGLVLAPEAPHPVTVALQPVDAGQTALHLLAADPGHRAALSRWIEAARRNIEGVAA